MPTNQPTMSHASRSPCWLVALLIFCLVGGIAFGFLLGATYAVAQDNAITAKYNP